MISQHIRNSINRLRISSNKYMAETTAENFKMFEDEVKKVNDLVDLANEKFVTKDEKSSIDHVINALSTYQSAFVTYNKHVSDQLDLQKQQRESSASLLSDSRELREGVYNYIDKTKQQAFVSLLLALIFSIILGLIISALVTRSITIPLNKSVRFADEISKGNLTSHLAIDQKDEIGLLGNALNNMISKLREIVNNISTSSNEISGASNEISTASQQLSQSSNEQASSVEEISSTVEEISSNIQQNTDNSQQTESIAKEAYDGIHTVNEMTIEAVNANKRIAEKINIINDIAFQTNILVLNAAVEAARAGEYGRGFAVVAAEVRKLAELSKSAAEEIVDLSNNSVKLSSQAGEKLGEMLPKVKSTANLVQEIAAASLEQNNGVNYVTKPNGKKVNGSSNGFSLEKVEPNKIDNEFENF